MASAASKIAFGFTTFSQSELFFQLQMAAHYGGRHFTKGFSQSALFFQFKMAACYGGRHFRGTQLQNTIWLRGVQLVEHGPLQLNRASTILLHVGHNTALKL